jgi:cob(I)alamin adenosyltransferase
MIQVFTGDGKGKTTAALGQALRAAGHGWHVLVIQFMKGDPSYGELTALKKLRGITVIQSGLPTFVEKGNPSAEDVRLAQEGMNTAERAIRAARHQMIVLDEVNVAVDYGLVSLEQLMKLVRSCPNSIELVLTGRYAKPDVIDAADLVSEVREVKHPYRKGIVGREGIDH